ncbi:MAG: cell envelope biogenesis protein OmpA [Bacteroidetes bacterium]|nr:MAG: cell envelope biogenesis protein OmpA [Bacteroidota bacterium]TAE62315.1 MAG: cell envelope biogenesis protein OmpA [Bacteroidota bacterium]TAF98477.1 MAG: cell envelope biogenesis protein OmpA [Bacteroidota bacterium]
MTDTEKLLQLKNLLLDEDRELAQKILQKLDELQHTIDTKPELAEKVNPIIDDKLKVFTEEIPGKLGPTIALALEEQIKNSQEQVVNILFPIIGKMIKKYIASEIKALSDSINAQINKTFSFKRYTVKIKSFFTGFGQTEVMISEMAKSKVVQVYIVEKGSGLLLGSFSKQNTIDEDMLAGMLTAIKSFGEDAVQTGDQSLELIEYEFYKIYLKNFHTYYVAMVISGIFDDVFKNKLEDDLFRFAKKQINPNIQNKAVLNTQLAHFFKDA